VTSVDAGELLVEYVQPQKGKPGRTFGGRFIDVEEPEVNHYPEFGVDSKTVEVKTEEGRKRYYALDEGYVKIENNILTVDKTVTVGDINLKSTGNVRAGVDKDVKVQVAGKDPSEEVIGSDMVVEAMEVDVNGSVASNAKVKAGLIQITGQTHKTSELYGGTVEVNVLRGLASGEKVTVKSLEGGMIRADEAIIEQSVGGEVNASVASVQNLRGKTRIRAAKSITVQQVLKGENRLTIDPMAHQQTAEAIRAARETVEEIKQEMQKSKKSIEHNENYLKKNHESFKQMQQKVMEDKKEGRPPSDSFLRMVREYLGVHKKQEALKERIEELEQEIETKRGEVAHFDEQVLEATVINESAKWMGHNEIRFRLPVLEKEYLYSVSEGERIAKLKLVESEDGDYEIMTVHG
jgi:predicted RNA-binding protein (virulence factor B family)